MSNPLANKELKIRAGGQKLKVRIMADGERINSRCLQIAPMQGLTVPGESNDKADLALRHSFLSEPNVIELMSHNKWQPCNCVGERNDEYGHGHRIYVEVLSPFYVPASDDSGTERKEKGKADL